MPGRRRPPAAAAAKRQALHSPSQRVFIGFGGDFGLLCGTCARIRRNRIARRVPFMILENRFSIRWRPGAVGGWLRFLGNFAMKTGRAARSIQGRREAASPGKTELRRGAIYSRNKAECSLARCVHLGHELAASLMFYVCMGEPVLFWYFDFLIKPRCSLDLAFVETSGA